MKTYKIAGLDFHFVSLVQHKGIIEKCNLNFAMETTVTGNKSYGYLLLRECVCMCGMCSHRMCTCVCVCTHVLMCECTRHTHAWRLITRLPEHCILVIIQLSRTINSQPSGERGEMSSAPMRFEHNKKRDSLPQSCCCIGPPASCI